MKELINKPQYIIVGAGLTGAILANKISKDLDANIILIEKCKHIGGRYYDYIDKNSKLLINKYQQKIFNSDDKNVLDFVNKYTSIKRFEYQILNLYNKTNFHFPINVNTINKVCNTNIQDIDLLNEWLDKNINYSETFFDNTKKKAISKFGEDIYNNYLEPYLKKKWRRDVNDLSFCVLDEFEIRKNQDNFIYKNKKVGFFQNGYTSFIQRLISGKNITLVLETDFFEFKKNYNLQDITIIYTGKIDDYFYNSNLNKLEYLNVTTNNKTFITPKYKQECSVINNLDSNIEYFSSVEYKYYSKTRNFKTLISYQTIDNSGDLIPIPSIYNLNLYDKYKKLGEEEKNVHFIGTLAQYKNFSVSDIIKNALNLFNKKIKPFHKKQPKTELKKNNILKVIFLCRFNKNIDWVKKLADSDLIDYIIIFNYGKLLTNFSHKKIKIKNKIDKNITVELSYTLYLIENYHSLPKYIWFINENLPELNKNFNKIFDINMFNNYKYKKSFNLSSFNAEKMTIFDISGLNFNNYLINKKNLKFAGHNCNLNLDFYNNPDNLDMDLLCEKFNLKKAKYTFINYYFGNSLFVDTTVFYNYKLSFFENCISIINKNDKFKKYYKYIFSYLFSNNSIDDITEYYKKYIDSSYNIASYDETKNILDINNINNKNFNFIEDNASV